MAQGRLESADPFIEMRLRLLVLLIPALLPSAYADLSGCLPRGSEEKPYAAYEMEPHYVGDDASKRVYYTKPENQANHKLATQDGRFVTGNSIFGIPRAARDHWLYVMSATGDFYLMADTRTQGASGVLASAKIRHSSILAGAPVACAGMITLDRGKVTYISTSSGHYKPVDEQLRAALDSLYRKGFDLSEAQIAFGGNKITNGRLSAETALSFLFHTPESRSCIEALVRVPEATTAKDLRELRQVEIRLYDEWLADAEADGKIPAYRDALAEVLSGNKMLRKYTPKSVLDLVGPLDRPSLCLRLFQAIGF
jgi:hypothetical protein